MAIDFNNAEEQKERTPGPVPAGSRVLLKIELQKPKEQYAAQPGSYVSVSKNGMYYLNAKFTVASGTYEGCHWFENWMLPEGAQKASMNEGQRQACRISYSRMRALVEAHRHIDPKDKSPRANSGRVLQNWLDLNGMTFPARLGIRKEGREVQMRDGSWKTFWDNQISSIVTLNDKEYADLMNGGETITDGPTEGEKAASRMNQNADDGGFDYDGAFERMNQPVNDDIPF